MIKLFSTKKEDYHTIINILGFKIKKLDSLAVINELNKLKNKRFLLSRQMFWGMEDKYTTKEKIWYLSQRFYDKVGYYPNFKYPRSYNEKLNWMKFNYNNPIHSICIDKYRAKEYISKLIGEEYVIPLLGVYDDVNDIDFEKLPNQFVIKNNISGGAKAVQIVRDKTKLNIDRLKVTFNNKLQAWNSLYYGYLTRGYKDIEPKIIIEEYVEQAEKQLYDYKIVCCHGEPKMFVAISDRKGDSYKVSYLDANWNKFDMTYGNLENSDIEKPKTYEKMIEVAKILSKDFPNVRVDMYEVGDKVYVGELSFTPCSALGEYKPIDWDYKMGEWIDLGKINPEHLQILPEFAEAAKTFIDPKIVDSHTVEQLV